jgi:hypothetical protein
LRRLLDEVKAAAVAVLRHQADCPTGESAALREVVARFREVLLIHMEVEEMLLEPLLESWPDHGALRLGLLRTEHVSQRALLDVLRPDREPPLGPHVLAWRSQWLADDLLADMATEEHELLDPLR